MGSVCFILLFVVSLVEVITGYYLMLYTIFDKQAFMVLFENYVPGGGHFILSCYI